MTHVSRKAVSALVGISVLGSLLVAFAPTAQAHTCSATLGALQCGACTPGSYHYHQGLLFGCQSCCSDDADEESTKRADLGERAASAVAGAWASVLAFVGVA